MRVFKSGNLLWRTSLSVCHFVLCQERGAAWSEKSACWQSWEEGKQLRSSGRSQHWPRPRPLQPSRLCSWRAFPLRASEGWQGWQKVPGAPLCLQAGIPNLNLNKPPGQKQRGLCSRAEDTSLGVGDLNNLQVHFM
jgi:hypothetical protein